MNNLTYCIASCCENTDCMRHKVNAPDGVRLSWAVLYGTDVCPSPRMGTTIGG